MGGWTCQVGLVVVFFSLEAKITLKCHKILKTLMIFLQKNFSKVSDIFSLILSENQKDWGGGGNG